MSEVESNDGCGKATAHCVSRWLLRGSLCVVWIWRFHPVGWCVVLQQHYGSGSRMVLASSVRCGLFILFPCRREAVPDGGYMRWRRLSAAALAEWSRSCRRPNPTGQCCLLETFAWLASTSQSD